MVNRVFELSDLNGVNGFTINGIGAGNSSGASVASAGDVNGDGIDDVIIGASTTDSTGQMGAGQSYVVFGRAGAWPTTLELSQLDGTAGAMINGIITGYNSGSFVAAAGDVNGDGVGDVIIGALLADPGGRNDAGQSYLVFGRNGTWPSELELASLNGSMGVIINGIAAGDQCGWCVASASDVNGDGIDDVIIGARYADPGSRDRAGQSYLVFGHNGSWPVSLELSSLNGTAGVMVNGIAAGDNSGRSVAAAGDINDDGIGDVIIGARYADPGGRVDAGQSYLLFGRTNLWQATLELSSLNSTAGVIINGIVGGDWSGVSVAAAGDVNGDNIDDVIIGAHRADPGGRINAAQSYIVFGHNGTWPVTLELSSLNGITGVIINGIAEADLSGRSVAAVGDVNGDGLDDVIIGANGGSPDGRINAGQSYVVFGRNSAWPAVLELSSLSGTTGVIINGIVQGDQSGVSAASAGDVNGDGIGDVIIGAVEADPGSRSNAGQSYVIFGGAEQFSANQISIQSGQMIRLTQENLAVDPVIGNRTFTVSNTSHVRFVSTYNTSATLSNFTQQQIHDGEILVIHDGSREAPSYTVSAEGVTRVFSDVHPQAANVSFSVGTPRVSAPHREFNLTDLNGVNGFTINGVAAGDLSGNSVASAGDVNGDGVDDFIVGAWFADAGGRTDVGQSYLIFGHNGSWPETIELSSLNEPAGVVVNGVVSGDKSGHSVAPSGDVNGDGVNDFLIGSYFADSNVGETYLIFGHSGRWPTSIELAGLNGLIGTTINGGVTTVYSGAWVSTCGDVNGDGLSDIIIGAYLSDPEGKHNAGESYVVFGHRGDWTSNLLTSTLNGSNGVVIPGINAGDFNGRAVGSAGDVNGDGFSDLLISSVHARPGNRTSTGQVYLIFGRREWPRVIDLASLNQSRGVYINGINPGDTTGTSVASGGDLNGDSLDDFLIGSYNADPVNRTNAGAAYIIFGHNGSWPLTIELSSLDGLNGVAIHGVSEEDHLGGKFDSAGDVNGDGIGDVIIGANWADPNQRSAAGQSYVLFGYRGVWPSSIDLLNLEPSLGVTINGALSGDHSGNSVATTGDVNADGVDDVIIGAYTASPNNQTNSGQSYVIFGGAEQFSSNQIEVQQGETLTLNTSNIEINPNIGSRMINVTDVSHGHFALASNTSTATNSFNQSQINSGEIVFVHDGGLQAPSYVVSAEGVTRVFSNVHPQRGNVSFIVSDAPTSAPTIMPTAIPTIAPTAVPTVAPSARPTFLSTVALIAVPTIAPTAVPSLNPTSFFGVPTDVPTIAPVSVPTSAPTIAPFSISPTALINGVETAVTNDGGGDSDSGALVGGIAGGLVAVVALLLVGFFIYRRRQNEERKKLVQGVTGDEMRTVAMTLNPAFMAGANAPDAIASGEGVGDDPAVQYESPRLASRGTGSSVLDEDNYVAQTGSTVIITGADGATYAVPMATDDGAAGVSTVDNQYRVFRSVGADGGSEADPNAGSGNGNDTYRVFRSASAASSVT